MTKGFKKGIAIVLGVAILAGGICAAGYCSRDDSGKWFRNSDLASWAWTKDKPQEDKPSSTSQANTWGGVIDDVGNVMNETATTYAMPAALAFYSTTTTKLAQQLKLGAPSVTVTCSHNFEFNNVFVDWSIEYPSGASAADIATVTPKSDGSLTATVSCSGAFSEPLTLKATLRGNAEKTATCRVDYVKRIDGFNDIYMCGSDFEDPSGIGCSPVFGTGSVNGNLKVSSVFYRLHEDFKSDVLSYLKFNVSFKSYSDSDFELGANNYTDRATFEYSMFIDGFDDYDEAHKNAIYYAWRSAYMNCGWRTQSNISLDVDFQLLHNGKILQTFSETDYLPYGTRVNSLSGDCYGYDISPDLTLNNNVAL